MRRVVLDTNVIISGLRSQRGAAFRVLSLVGSGLFEHCLSVTLAFEYEDAIKRSVSGIRFPLCQDRCRMREQMESGARERKRK